MAIYRLVLKENEACVAHFKPLVVVSDDSH